MIIENPVAVVVQDVLGLLRVPAVLNLATGGVHTPSSSNKVPMVLVNYQDSQGSLFSNLNGEPLIDEVYFNILAVADTKDLELVHSIDNQVRKRLLGTNLQPMRTNSKGTVYSCTLMAPRNYQLKAQAGEMIHTYYGGYYRFRVRGNEL